MTETRPTNELRPHPQADLIPQMSPHQAKSFDASVARHGILFPIEITEAGVIVDGHHRHRTALKLGLDAVPVRVIAPDDEIDYMYSAAIERRHLGDSQCAALAIKQAAYLAEREAASARKNGNLRNGFLDVAHVPHREGRSRDTAAKLAGVSPRLIQNVLKVADHDPALFEQIIAGELTANRALQMIEREENYAAIGVAPVLPDGPFQLIYADPPWRIGTTNSPSAPDHHYPTMPLDEIAAMLIPSADDALLYLWAVNSHLLEALEVMAAWGFTYRSNEVWDKCSPGHGVWTRHQHELLLIGRKGNASPAHNTRRLASVVRQAKGRHSAKPLVFHERLEHLYPKRSKLELFARAERAGWTTWGNQVPRAIPAAR